jgi:5-methylthioadenosine/S-adenosylhomocysteine deaminase
MMTDYRFAESKKLVADYNGYDDGRIIGEMCVHAEYTNAEHAVRAVAEYAKENSLGIQLHASETESEHRECKLRRGKTPMEWFESLGVLDVPVTAAHCVWVSDNDISIMAEKKVSAVHCPISNLKLASGIMRINTLLDANVNVALGTDGASSNNRLDMLREMQTAAILHKGANLDPTAMPASKIYEIATSNGAIAQRRYDCGKISEGNRADLVLVNCNSVNNLPMYDAYSMLAYSASSADVLMTMVDGNVLYQNGEYKTIDIEKIKAEAKRTLKGFFAR